MMHAYIFMNMMDNGYIYDYVYVLVCACMNA
jgi:hypothetical protein